MYFSTTKFVLAMTLLLSFALHGLPSCSATRLLQTGGLKYLEQPEVAWQAQADIILKGNGVFTSPDDKISVVTQSFGKITAFDTKNGTMLWSFTPPVNSGRPTSCQGGATFSMNGPSDYIVYSVVDEPNGIRPVTRVVSLSFDGNLNWVSIPLEGAAAGSPLTSYDGRYVYLTHNSNFMSIGHFTVLDILGATTDTAIFPLYSEFNQTNPFSPPGIYHNPAEGYYDGGQGNTNDIVVWAHAPNPTEGGVGSGASFVFQFPMNYVGSSQAEARQADGQNQLSMPLYWNILGDEVKNWQSTSAPVLANYGRSLYWSVSRSQFRAWVGQAGSNVERFSRFRTSSPSFRRGNPPYVAPPNSPALSSNSTEPMIFVGSAGNEFVKMDYLMTEDTAIIRNTASSVSSRAIVSPDDEYVYFTEFTGFLHQARTSDLEDAWVQGGTAPLDGEFSLTSDGTMLIVGDVTGKITAYKVASSPTAPPTLAPTLAPTSEPTQPKPTGFRPTDNVPIPVPGSQPTSKPTLSPTFSPTGTPTDPPRQPTRPVESSSASAPTVTTSLLFAFTTLAVAFLSLLV